MTPEEGFENVIQALLDKGMKPKVHERLLLEAGWNAALTYAREHEVPKAVEAERKIILDHFYTHGLSYEDLKRFFRSRSEKGGV